MFGTIYIWDVELIVGFLLDVYHVELLVIGEQDGSRSFGWILVLEVYCGLLQVKGYPLFKGDYVEFSAESSLGGGLTRGGS